MNTKKRKTLSALLALVFLLSAGLIILQMLQSNQAEQINAEAIQLAVGSESTPTEPEEVPDSTQIPESDVPLDSGKSQQARPPLDAGAALLQKLDIVPLQQVNSDVLGWIHIPDTEISYPLLCADTYDEYLYKAWNGTQNTNGSIYLECRNRTDLSDFNSIIYGHNLSDGTMFGSLKDFADPEFSENHPYIYVRVGSTIRRYAVFASYMATVNSKTYWLNFSGSDARADAIAYYREMSNWPTELQPSGNDRILTLSTCSGTGNYTYRWVVQAVLDQIWNVE